MMITMAAAEASDTAIEKVEDSANSVVEEWLTSAR